MANKVTTNIDYYARMVPDRLVCGLMHIIVRNSSGQDDAVDEYYTHWSGTAPTNAKTSSPFDSVQPINEDDPNRTDYSREIGDYDCMLMYVIAGCHLEAEAYAGSAKDQEWFDANTPPEYPGGDDPGRWYGAGEITHAPCQSFVRYRVLSRGNNAYGHGATWYHNPVVTTTYAGPEGLFDTDEPTNVNLLSDTKYDHPLVLGSDYDFGNDLETVANNTYMSPIAGINITAGHKFTLNTMTNGATELNQLNTHEYDFFNLVLRLKLFSYYDTVKSANVSYFKNRVNVFFQPFGETSELEFSTTEYTS